MRKTSLDIFNIIMMTQKVLKHVLHFLKIFFKKLCGEYSVKLENHLIQKSFISPRLTTVNIWIYTEDFFHKLIYALFGSGWWKS